MRLTLFLDHACNLACSYCYNGEKFKNPMPMDTARLAVDLVLAMDSPLAQVGFFGGEPMLHFDLMKEITRYVEHRTHATAQKVKLVLTTNGTLLTQESLEWMKQHYFHLGVSIDGNADAHNACRRYVNDQTSHEEVEAGIKRALALRLPVKTISVVDPLNVDHMADSLEYLLGLGIRNMSFNLNYEAQWDEANRERFKNAFAAFTDRYIELYRREPQPFRVNIIDSKIVTHVKGGFACTDRCDFGCQELAVSPTGKLYPCDRLIGEDDRDEVVIGDVVRGVDIKKRDRLVHAKNVELEECQDCDIVDRCMHWCGCVNYAMTGSVAEVSGLLCWFEQQMVEQADRAANTLFVEQNENFVKRFYKFALKP